MERERKAVGQESSEPGPEMPLAAGPHTPHPPSYSVLVVDDQLAVCQTFVEMVCHHGHYAEWARSEDEALKLLRQKHFHLCLLDWKLRDRDALALLPIIKRTWPHIVVIMYSGYETDVGLGVKAKELGAATFLKKPIGLDRLAAEMDRAMARHEDGLESEAKRELREKRGLQEGRVPTLVGSLLAFIEANYNQRRDTLDLGKAAVETDQQQQHKHQQKKKLAGWEPSLKDLPPAYRRAKRAFRRLAGITPLQYMRELRLCAANRYVRESRLPLAEVAQKCGFGCYEWFERRYHGAYGQNPRAVRAALHRRAGPASASASSPAQRP